MGQGTEKVLMKEGRKKMRVFSSEEELDEIKEQIKKQLKEMRTRANLTQNDIEEKCSCCSARTYQKMESGNIGVRYESFLEVFRLFQGTDHDAAILFGNHPSGLYLSSDQDGSACHLARLNKFTHQSYTINYVDSMDKMKHMKIKFGDIIDNTFVYGTAMIGRKYKYECKLVSPVNSSYVFLYLTSSTSLVDRALLVLPEIELIVEKFKRGIGIMMSISIDRQQCPTTQKFVMLHNSYKGIRDEEILPYLVVKREQISKYMFRIPDLKGINSRFAENPVFTSKGEKASAEKMRRGAGE